MKLRSDGAFTDHTRRLGSKNVNPRAPGGVTHFGPLSDSCSRLNSCPDRRAACCHHVPDQGLAAGRGGAVEPGNLPPEAPVRPAQPHNILTDH